MLIFCSGVLLLLSGPMAVSFNNGPGYKGPFKIPCSNESSLSIQTKGKHAFVSELFIFQLWQQAMP